MQRAGAALMARPLLGRDVFARGAPEGIPRIDRPVYELSLYELLSAYGDSHRRRHGEVLIVAPPALHSLDEALRRLGRLGRPCAGMARAGRLSARGVAAAASSAVRRLAATFAAMLELARAGRIELRQERAFGPIYLRSRPAGSSGLREIPG